MKTIATQVAAQAAATLTVTEKLYSLFDQFGVEALSVNLARDAAEAYGLNRTSAEIAFYRWQADRRAA